MLDFSKFTFNKRTLSVIGYCAAPATPQLVGLKFWAHDLFVQWV